jgi:hypothetical protein
MGRLVSVKDAAGLRTGQPARKPILILSSHSASSGPPGVGWSVTGGREAGLALLLDSYTPGESDSWTHTHR